MTTATATDTRTNWHAAHSGMTADELAAVNAPPPPKLTKAAQTEADRREHIRRNYPAIYATAQQMSERAAALEFYSYTDGLSDDERRRDFVARIWRGAFIAATGGVRDPAAHRHDIPSDRAPGTTYNVTTDAPIC